MSDVKNCRVFQREWFWVEYAFVYAHMKNINRTYINKIEKFLVPNYNYDKVVYTLTKTLSKYTQSLDFYS